MTADIENFPVLQFAVSTLPGHPDLALLRAAGRAGALPILDLEAVEAIEDALVAFLRSRQGRVGVRIESPETLEAIPAAELAGIDVIVLAARGWPADVPLPAVLRAAPRTILAECTNVEEARAAAAWQVDGLIAKGHEAAGRVGEETTFVLVQRLLDEGTAPVWAHGGIGTHTIAAVAVAGCAGVVLDSQLALARESSLPEAVKVAVERMTGDETICLGAELGERFRVYRRPGPNRVQELQQLDAELAREPATEARRHRWRAALSAGIAWRGGPSAVWPLGQDAAFAADLAGRFRSVSGILSGLRTLAIEGVEHARDTRPLDRHSPLARSHGTDYPILQGPMTRVSDTAPFAAAVADAGGLPFLALALLRAPQVRTLLSETRERLGTRPWGVGILGFVPLELREEQFAVIEEIRPPFALIAGGRPDQAAKLERLGIPTYLHVPAPALLKMFLDAGARRFVFEGRECGGHVGPRTSFVLWQLAVNVLADAIARGVRAEELHVVFAGGIHDARSAAMVATIGAPLARAGVRVGVLLGTAYLFTEEAVSSGAILPGFQQEALVCSRTVLLETGPGHATRCAETPFAESFRETRLQLITEGRSPDDIRIELESLNLGRLRVAAKGIRRDGSLRASGAAVSHVSVSTDEQHRQGLYMIGQVAALRRNICRIADLHREISIGSTARLGKVNVVRVERPLSPPAAASGRVAIVGLGCILPKAPDVRTLWSNILSRVDAIGEVPPDRFDAGLYYDADRRAKDRIYSKWGGFLDEVPFDPLKHGIPPSAVPSIDPFQLLTLEVVDQALRDAGYATRPFNRERTSVILGASGGVGDLGFRYGIRAGLPMFLDPVPREVYGQLPEWTEDSFAGVLLNVAAGRVANRLDLGGLNFTVDAACASSLAAVFLAVRELETGGSDMVLVGGIDTVNSPFGYLCFSSAQALSPRGRCSTFDESADGIAISEGLAVVVLKRLEDAERDGDRVYAVIKAVAGSSDGRGKGLTAPRPEGQMRVLERAYAAADISPASIGLIEAHGTGTVAGDGAEVTALSRVFAGAGAAPQECALGSIKSMIGHTKSAAGVTGLLKVALSLHHKVLPPTLNVQSPNPKLRDAETPFYVNTETRPWMASGSDRPRRAGVSSFGFGGTNFHVVVEEYDAQPPGTRPEMAAVDLWPAELAVWSAASSGELIAALEEVGRVLAESPDVPLRTVAAAVCRDSQARGGDRRLAIVAENIADLRNKVETATRALEEGRTSFTVSTGIHAGIVPGTPPPVAFLFPGQGSQYPGMHRELSVLFPDIRHALEVADEATRGLLPRRLSSYVFPPPAFTPAETAQRAAELTDTAIAQPALGAVETGLLWLFERLGVAPSFTAGHSYGEYVALHAAGVLTTSALFALSAARGRLMKEAGGDRSGAMAAVVASPAAVERALGGDLQVAVANLNAPTQTVIAGSAEAIAAALERLSTAGLTARRLDVACAFHSPLVAPAQREMAAVLAQTPVQAPRIPVFSNTLAAPYPDAPAAIREVLASHIAQPVRFVEQIDSMYAAGARVFIELGPRPVLTNLVREILAGRDALLVPLNAPGKPELPQLLTGLAQLAVAGLHLDLEVLWQGRSIPSVRVSRLGEAAPARAPAHAWMVSGGRARRQDHPITAVTRVQIGAAADPPTLAAPTGSGAAPMPLDGGDAAPAPAPPAAVRRPAPSLVRSLVRSGKQPESLNGGSMQSESSRPFDAPSGDHDAVMRQFQQLMSQFLQTQALVMTSYLQGVQPGMRPAVSLPDSDAAAAGVAPRLAVPHPGTAAVAVPPRGLGFVPGESAAAPGPIDGSARPAAPPPPVVHVRAQPAPIAAAVAAAAPAPVRSAAAATAADLPDASTSRMAETDVLQALLHIVSDRTGYPEDMLAVDANIEADLGIDSIKRMEILAAFQEAHGGASRGAFQESLERLTAIKTLRESAAALTEILGAGDVALA